MLTEWMAPTGVMEPWHLVLLALAGCIAGFMNVIAGGGSLLTVPIMVFLDIPGPVANGTNRIAILAQCITAVVTFFNKGYSDVRLSLTLSLCALPGAVAGALLGTHLEGAWFNRTLALVMIGVMLLMGLDRGRPAEQRASPGAPRNLLAGHLLMVAIGAYGGFIQIGVGFLFMPVLYRVLGLDMVTANMHKVFITGIFTFAALIVFAARVPILWLVGITLALGFSLGGWFGARISIRKGARFINLVLQIILVVFIIKLLLF